MNTTTTALPPAQKGSGCFGKGCATLAGLLIFLVLAFVGGGFWAVHHLRDTYSSSEPIELPTDESDFETAATDSSSVPLPNSTITSAGTGTAAPQAAAIKLVPIEKRWKAFEKAKDPERGADIVLTASEINALISSSSNARGKAFVSIDNNIARVRVSIPLEKVFMMEGRYLNGEASVEASPDGNPSSARITNIVLNNRSVSDGLLDQRVFGWSSIRTHISNWLDHEQITSFRIENNRVLGEKRGSR